MYNSAVYQRHRAAAAKIKRMAVKNRNIRILADFQRTDAGIYARNACSVYGYCLQGCILRQTFPNGKCGANGQILYRNNGVIRHYCEFYSVIEKSSCGCQAAVANFGFAALMQQRADDNPRIQLIDAGFYAVDYHVTFGKMIQRDFKIELLCNAQSRHYIVRTVRMNFERKLTAHNGQHRFE